MTNRRHSRRAASPLNHGFHVPESIFSPRSRSDPGPKSSGGRRRSRIPQTPPGYRARGLFVVCYQPVIGEGARGGSFVRTFSRVKRLRALASIVDPGVSLAPLYKFSPTLKALCMYFVILPRPQIFNLVRSFPLLEDLVLEGHESSRFHDEDPDGPLYSTSPPLTGTLDLDIREGIGHTTRWLLSLPNGLHFRKLALSWYQEGDIRWIMEVVERCSDTLKSLHVRCHLQGAFVWFCTGATVYLPP